MKPTGRFKQRTDELFMLILLDLQDYRALDVYELESTNEQLAVRMGVSTGQLKRYLKVLLQQDKISVRLVRRRIKDSYWSNTRYISLKEKT